MAIETGAAVTPRGRGEGWGGGPIPARAFPAPRGPPWSPVLGLQPGRPSSADGGVRSDPWRVVCSGQALGVFCWGAGRSRGPACSAVPAGRAPGKVTRAASAGRTWWALSFP